MCSAFIRWTCIYPIYIDAKRPFGTGQRRLPRAKSLWWPLSKDIADASSRLGLGVLHEVHKSHPRDWENPGRVRVQWKKDGRLVNPIIQTSNVPFLSYCLFFLPCGVAEKQLLEMIALQIQRNKPDNIPKAPYTLSTPKPPSAPPPLSSTKHKSSSNKPKPPAPTTKQSGRRLPVPPDPQPQLSIRLSPYSPALPTGVLIETVKAGMNAESGAAAGPGAPAVGGAGKGKRKVVRVRGG